MAFLQLDDGFADHRKVDPLSDAAFRLHVAGMLYAARNLTNGEVPEARIRRLVPRFKPGALLELVDARLWLPVAAGYAIHDYLDWNPSREAVLRRREQARKRKAKWLEEHGE